MSDRWILAETVEQIVRVQFLAHFYTNPGALFSQPEVSQTGKHVTQWSAIPAAVWWWCPIFVRHLPIIAMFPNLWHFLLCTQAVFSFFSIIEAEQQRPCPIQKLSCRSPGATHDGR